MSKTTHVLKSWPRFFDAIRLGTRTHELRRNDRDFQVGDLLELREYEFSMSRYTGRTCIAEITSITSTREPCAVSDEALHRDFCILSVRLITSVTGNEAAE
ncbi:DUF3850 domain-containing protein [Paraburkholderia madseniana]|uniref:DUF3850 domain-containing protein n=1 Tax=Paraburkholderia madseniana TaxID=2599607 RepID=A0A6N6WB32_9BURK|nr:DUF3850 domain-containing protein [Paraburkholderia madseniana]